MSEGKEIKGIECKFAVHLGRGKNNDKDLHLVKEVVHYKDGTMESRLNFIEEYPRSFWVSKPARQKTHKFKKEWEELQYLSEYKTTQSDLNRTISKALGMVGNSGNKQLLFSSPYLYGADISSTALLKNDYKTKYPECSSPNTVAVLDIETCVFGTDRIILVSVTMGNKAITTVLRDFIKGVTRPIEKIRAVAQEQIGEYLSRRNIDWEIVICDTEKELLVLPFKRLHEWKPDFVAVWNINFDIPKIISRLKEHDIKPEQIFSDPSVPPEYRFYHYKEGKNKKPMASGKIMPVKVADQWHVLRSAAGFWFLDAMCVYRRLRLAKPYEPSYALNAILEKVLGIRKLKTEVAAGTTGLGFHKLMQSQHPIEYVVYNLFDDISVEELNEKTTDLSLAFPLQCGISDFNNFNSEPRRNADNLHFFCLDQKNHVIGTSGDNLRDGLEKYTFDLDNWITALNAHNITPQGLRCIEGAPSLVTRIYVNCFDLDVSGAYPTNGEVFNVSKTTTVTELSAVEGVPEAALREQCINFSSGATNSIEFSQVIFKAASVIDFFEAFERDHAIEMEEV